MSPTTNGVGHSGYTWVKQDRLRAVSGHLLGVASRAVKRPYYDPWLLAVDLCAGDGWPDDEPGSPIILGRHIIGLRDALGDLVCCEKRAETADDLRVNLTDLKVQPGAARRLRTTVLEGDHKKTFLGWLDTQSARKARLGVVYFDPNGKQALPVDIYTAMDADKRWRSLDVLIHVQGTAWKRCHGDGLQDQIESVPKARKFICGEYGKGSGNPWHSTFFFATNYAKARPPKDFYPLESSEGQLILFKATHEKSEWPAEDEPKRGQLRLVA